jgi:hypothetical protein
MSAVILAGDLLKQWLEWTGIYIRDTKNQPGGHSLTELQGNTEKFLADPEDRLERLQRFAGMTISTALRSYRWHASTGMKPAWVPPMNPSVAKAVLRDAKHCGLITQEEIDGDSGG